MVPAEIDAAGGRDSWKAGLCREEAQDGRRETIVGRDNDREIPEHAAAVGQALAQQDASSIGAFGKWKDRESGTLALREFLREALPTEVFMKCRPGREEHGVRALERRSDRRRVCKVTVLGHEPQGGRRHAERPRASPAQREIEELLIGENFPPAPRAEPAL
jgi:hypothetical protein